MFNIIKPGINIDFVGKRLVTLGFSGVLVLTSVVLLFTKGLNLGIDFTGGAELTVQVPKQWGITELRSELTKGGIKGVRVVEIGGTEENQYLVRAQGSDKELNAIQVQISGILAKTFPEGNGPENFAILKADVVGAVAGGLLIKNAFLAMFYALLVILIYVGIRFDSRYAPGAVLALFHDSLLVLGVFAITGKQFDLTILAAMLALVGYSNNDTIIVYDRVREMAHLHPEWNIEKAVNEAINSTLGRTIVTSLTTFFVVSSLFFLGGAVIRNFSFTLMVGVLIGTYSSVFVASSAIITISNIQKNRGKKYKSSKKKSKSSVEHPVSP